MQTTEQYSLLLCTSPDTDTAESLAKKLVEEALAACVNVVPGLKSFYQWQGELKCDGECLLIIKTEHAHHEELEKLIRASHPYELPEIIAVPINAGSKAYLDWISANTKLS